MNRIFLSHSSKDRAFVNRLALDLTARGFDVWYDQWELNVGDSILAKIQEGLQHSSWLVIVLSPHSVESRWVREELHSGLARELSERQVYVLPILRKDCEIPVFLRDKVYADFRRNYEGGLERLLATLRQRLDFAPADDAPSSPPRQEVDPPLGSVSRYRLIQRYEGGLGIAWVAHDQELRREVALKEIREYPEFHRIAGNRLGGDSADNPSSPGSLSGTWYGLTGHMELSERDGVVSGIYDWHGCEKAGSIRGKLEAGVVAFEWDLRLSGETGGGIFYLRSPGILVGGWWMSGDAVDPESLIKSHQLPRNRWDFKKYVTFDR